MLNSLISFLQSPLMLPRWQSYLAIFIGALTGRTLTSAIDRKWPPRKKRQEQNIGTIAEGVGIDGKRINSDDNS